MDPTPDQKPLQLLPLQCYSKPNQNLMLNHRPSHWKSILNSCNWSSIQSLSLSCCQISDTDIGIFSGRDWPNLLSLRLDRNQIGEAGIGKLVGRKLPVLNQLDLSEDGNKIGDRGLVILATTENLPSLRRLRINDTGISLHSFKFKENGALWNLDNLTYLNLNDNKLGALGVRNLVKIGLPCLQILLLFNCGIGNQGIHFLTKIYTPVLKQLHISYKYLRNDGYHILSHAKWPKLSIISGQDQEKVQPITVMLIFEAKWAKNMMLGKIIDGKKLKKDILGIGIQMGNLWARRELEELGREPERINNFWRNF